MMGQPGDTEHMQRALKLARLAPFTSPNPRVGCVLTRGAEVISEGYHRGSGTPHAEIEALSGCDASGSTMFVTLEPCTVEGRTPPCAPAVVHSGVRRVVIAMTDPDERVSGRGVEMLRASGVEVEVGLCAGEASELNRAYVHQRTTGRALLTLKLALSLDGRFAASDGSSRWITSEETRAYVHARRLEAGVVMTGSGTILADDPSLDVRTQVAGRQPLKVVLDGGGRVPASARIFSTPGEVVMVTTHRSTHEVQTGWKQAGAEVLIAPEVAGKIDVAHVLTQLGQRGVLEVFCEAGPALAAGLIAKGLVDRLEIHHGPVVLGAGSTLSDIGVSTIADAKRFATTSLRRVGDDVLITLDKEATYGTEH
jgi:diaminohydroxyphosphoribosylaminopyrimidine deaminase / 5-amino-6-(5-phosphoribosylamino)uracil reductase